MKQKKTAAVTTAKTPTTARRISWSTVAWCVFVAATLAGVSALAALDVFVWHPRQAPNGCKMTYMRPSYAPVPLALNATAAAAAAARGYRLWAYRENDASVKTPRGPGVAVLFVPGNGGSYKQVRSFASEAARRGGLAKTNARFDYYAADFGGELGAFCGTALGAQAEFVGAAAHELLDGYAGGIGIVLVGHSMGGVVARAAASASADIAKRVAAIVTLNTPHTRPVLGHSPAQASFYEHVLKMEAALGKKRPPLVSIGGGFRDTLVQTRLCDVGDGPLNATLLTAAMPSVFVEADHQCIVWCNQVVVAFDKALRSAVNTTRAHRVAATKASLANQLDAMLVGGALPKAPVSVSADASAGWGTAVSRLPAVFKRPKAGTWLTVDVADLIADGKDTLVVRASAPEKIFVLLCKDARSCKNAADSFVSVPASAGSGTLGSMLALGPAALSGIEKVSVEVASDSVTVALAGMNSKDAKSLPHPHHALAAVTKGIRFEHNEASILHIQAPRWRHDRPVAIKVDSPSVVDGAFLVLAFATPTSARFPREMVAKELKNGQSLRFAQHYPIHSFDVFVLPPPSAPAEYTVEVKLDLLGMLGNLLRSSWPFAISAAMAMLLLARIGGQTEGMPLFVAATKQAPAVLIGVSIFVLLAPAALGVALDRSVDEAAFSVVLAFVLCIAVEVVAWMFFAVGRLSSLLIRIPMARGIATKILLVSISGAIVAVAPSFFGIALSLLVLAHTSFGARKAEKQRRALAAERLRLVVIPAAFSAIEVFAASNLTAKSVMLRNGAIDGYEIAAIAALLEGMLGFKPLIGRHLPRRITSLFLTAAAVSVAWFAPFEVYHAATILAAATLLF